VPSQRSGLVFTFFISCIDRYLPCKGWDAVGASQPFLYVSGELSRLNIPLALLLLRALDACPSLLLVFLLGCRQLCLVLACGCSYACLCSFCFASLRLTVGGGGGGGKFRDFCGVNDVPSYSRSSRATLLTLGGGRSGSHSQPRCLPWPLSTAVFALATSKSPIDRGSLCSFCSLVLSLCSQVISTVNFVLMHASLLLSRRAA
jgi:hypothetical protein